MDTERNTDMEFRSACAVFLLLSAMQMPCHASHNNHRAKRLVSENDVGEKFNVKSIVMELEVISVNFDSLSKELMRKKSNCFQRNCTVNIIVK